MAEARPKHDPKAAISVIQRGLEMLSGHDVNVSMGKQKDIPMKMAPKSGKSSRRGK